MSKTAYRTEKIESGNPIVSEEVAWAYYAYVILSGKAKVLRIVDGQEEIVARLKEGDVVGELAIIGNRKRTASVIADGDVEVAMVPKDAILDMMRSLSKETRSKMDVVTSDLTQIYQISGTLSHLLHEIQDLNKKVLNIDTLKKELMEEIKDVPEIYRHIFSTLVERRASGMETLKKLSHSLEKSLVGQ